MSVRPPVLRHRSIPRPVVVPGTSVRHGPHPQVVLRPWGVADSSVRWCRPVVISFCGWAPLTLWLKVLSF